MKKVYKLIPFLVILFSVCVFFYPFLLQGKLPIPADTITGLYYPFRDLYSSTNPNGLPYKNFLITDPVRQQYPWKNLSINLEKQNQLPLWNPYSMAGMPLLANFQSSAFYPLNLILFLQPFERSWSFFIMLEPLLAGIFLYLYLKHLRLDTRASLLGSLTWMFCGFSIAWLEWGVVLHTMLWLPLILLSIDISFFEKKILMKDETIWKLTLLFSLCASFLAGHLQSFFYVFVFTVIYFLARWFQFGHNKKQLFKYAAVNVFFVVLTFFQWFPTLQFILRSNRFTDQVWTQPGWFIPWQNLVQFVAPDYFGNPATLNYFGVWNYAEFIGYIGIGSFILALYALITRRDKKTLFFGVALLASLLLALPSIVSQIPYMLQVPFLSSAQPTRLLAIVTFSLAVLSALGLDYLLKHKSKVWIPIIVLGIILGILWGLGYGNQVSASNLKLPSILFVACSIILLGYSYVKNKSIKKVLIVVFILVSLFDLFRFGWKFTPFSDAKYLYPSTKIIHFLQNQPGVFRIAATDSRILPPNFSIMYHLQSIEGYDPLYLKNYAMFISANERTDHSITSPYGFNRIITPRNLDSQAIDFLNVKYVLSLTDLNNTKFKKIMQVGETRLYENLSVLPRAYFVEKFIYEKDESRQAKLLFHTDLLKTAIIGLTPVYGTYPVGKVKIVSYTPNKVVLETENTGNGYIVISDSYYKPLIRATIDGKDATEGILPVNLSFRSLFVLAGKHTVVFEAKLF